MIIGNIEFEDDDTYDYFLEFGEIYFSVTGKFYENIRN